MAYPVTALDVQTHLRLGTLDAAETAEIDRMIEAATEYAESFCNTTFSSGFVDIHRNEFPPTAKCGLVINTRPSSDPVVSYYDTTNTQHTLTGLRHLSTGGVTRIYPAFGESWPSDCNNEVGNITILTPVSTTDIPSSVKAAILLLVGDMYENRENSVTGQGVINVAISLTAERLLNPYKTRVA